MLCVLVGVDVVLFDVIVFEFVFGLYYEQQYQELIVIDMFYVFLCNLLWLVFWLCMGDEVGCVFVVGDVGLLCWLFQFGGFVEIGYDGDVFLFDNEWLCYIVFVWLYEIVNCFVMNVEFVVFVVDGGYMCFEFWLFDGWVMVQWEGW